MVNLFAQLSLFGLEPSLKVLLYIPINATAFSTTEHGVIQWIFFQQVCNTVATLRYPSVLFREEIMNVLLDMQYSMQAEAYVGVLTSNFGRMLDYLRATVGCKANRVYLDALHGPNPLKHIHCRTKCVF